MESGKSEPALHPDIGPLGFLLGTWVGEGRGDYPTIESFAYGEELHMWHVGKPFIAYSQRTWNLDDSRPLHSEVGYWRVGRQDRVELVLAHPTGIVEIEEGSITDQSVELESSFVGRTPTAKEVRTVIRHIEVNKSLLTYTVSMSAVGQPLYRHLSAELKRIRS